MYRLTKLISRASRSFVIYLYNREIGSLIISLQLIRRTKRKHGEVVVAICC